MATRLATQRNFLAITTTNKEHRKQILNQNNKIITNNNNSGLSGNIVEIAQVERIERNNSNESTEVTLIPTKKFIKLQQNDADDEDGIEVINIGALDGSESSNEDAIINNGDIQGGNIITNIATLKADLDNSNVSGGGGGDSGGGDGATSAQQIDGQVTVVQTADNDSDSPQYITVTVSTQDGGGPGESYQVQYLNPEHYHNNSQSQNQISYPFCAVSDYQSNSQSYYAANTTNGSYANTTNTTSSQHTSMPYIVPLDDGILLSSQSRDSPQSLSEVAYIQENHNTPQTPTSTTASLTDTDTNANLNHATRISPATVSWLVENYETAEGVSLPRSTLYNHYKQHCDDNKLEAVNAASFGKLIRSVFTGLRTRRLGTRGNSKYHYYGIRLKPGSSLATSATVSSAVIDEKPTNFSAHSSGHTSSTKSSKKSSSKLENYEACSQFLGDGSTAIPLIPIIDFDNSFLHEITLDDIEVFRSMYREHCELFLDAVLNLEFNTIESLWRDFWRSSDNNNLDDCEEEKYLSKTKLYLLCQSDNVQNFIKQVDYAFYQNMVDVLIPDVLRSIPNSLTQAIRNFAKNLEIWLTESMAGCPEKIVQIKSSAVSALCQTLRRYTSLNHLAQAARAVLQNSSQISQMLNDLNRVDFHNVQEQAAWVCQCDTAIVQQLENDFKAALQQQNSLEQWAAWLRLVVDSALEEYRGKPNYAKAARQFLLKWSFYSSMVIRDLTLRSASSFGSFHLIRLLYDEYMFFLIEHKVAEALNTTAIAVMSDKLAYSKDPEFEFSYPVEFITKSNELHSHKRLKH